MPVAVYRALGFLEDREQTGGQRQEPRPAGGVSRVLGELGRESGFLEAHAHELRGREERHDQQVSKARGSQDESTGSGELAEIDRVPDEGIGATSYEATRFGEDAEAPAERHDRDEQPARRNGRDCDSCDRAALASPNRRRSQRGDRSDRDHARDEGDWLARGLPGRRTHPHEEREGGENADLEHEIGADGCERDRPVGLRPRDAMSRLRGGGGGRRGEQNGDDRPVH